MCGITAYIGKNNASLYIMDGLSKLEYRGYDSAGISILNKNIKTVKKEGKLNNLSETISTINMDGNIGIGHTRWATHGGVSTRNSHPHNSMNDNISIVHNGIIENYLELKSELIDKGYEFKSDTDTEVIVHLIDMYYENDLLKSVTKALKRLEGSYALCIISSMEADKIICASKKSPLIIGVMEDEHVIASDLCAIISYTKDFYLLDSDDIAVVKDNSVVIYNNDKIISKKLMKTSMSDEVISKNGFEHYMMSEIVEQPKIIEKTINELIFDIDINKYNNIYMVACGTAYHACLVGKYYFEKYLNIKVDTALASEFRYSKKFIDENTLCIFVSQSGETLDTIEALKDSKSLGATCVSITNRPESSITRVSDIVIKTYAGIEVAVASTKAYIAQITTFYIIAKKLSKNSFNLDEVILNIKEIINNKETIKDISNRIKDDKNIFFLGRGIDYLTSLEGALKCKEISYIHCEAIASGEIKHGSIALIEKGTKVIVNASTSSLLDKSISNIKEIKARGAYVILITQRKNEYLKDIVDEIVFINDIEDDLVPFTSVVIYQLLAYYLAYLKGLDIDKPRNLAKSVTVE